jgi:uncharacterized protein
MQKFKRIGGVLLLMYTFTVIMINFLQEKMIFLPTKLPGDYKYSFAHDFEEVNLTTEEGYSLNAIHFKKVDSRGLILYFHGNAGDLSRWGDIASFFVERNYDVLVMDYRTFGKSTGELSERALHDDAQLFYDYVLKQYEEEQISLYGRSLGTGIATKLASRNKPNRLILETPYYSLLDVAQDRFPFLPIKWSMKYKLLSYEYIQEVTCPIYIFHGTDDRVISYDSGKRLFESIPTKKKTFYTIDGGNHNNLVQFNDYLNGMEEVLK